MVIELADGNKFGAMEWSIVFEETSIGFDGMTMATIH